MESTGGEKGTLEQEIMIKKLNKVSSFKQNLQSTYINLVEHNADI